MGLSKDYVNGMIELYKKAYDCDSSSSQKIEDAINKAIQLNHEYEYEEKLYDYLTPKYKSKVEKYYINCDVEELEQNSVLNEEKLIKLRNRIFKKKIKLDPEELLEIYESFRADNKYIPVWQPDTNTSE